MGTTFQAADRALEMLEAFRQDRQELGVSAMADELGIHRSTASRLAATLEQRGFLARVPGHKTYRLGPTVGRLGMLAMGNRDLATAARPAMESLANETGETINLATLDADGVQAVNVVQIEGKHLVGVGVWTGRRTPLHCVANGKVLLAFAEAKLPAKLESFTPKTITTHKALEAELEAIRKRGFATNAGEIEEGLHAVAAPVFDAYGRCVAALSVSAPAFRLPARQLNELGARCAELAKEIGTQLSATPR